MSTQPDAEIAALQALKERMGVGGTVPDMGGLTVEKVVDVISELSDALTKIRDGRAAKGLVTEAADKGLADVDLLKATIANSVNAQFTQSMSYMCNQVLANAVEKGFYPEGFIPSEELNNGCNDGEKLALVHSEVSEILECARDGYTRQSEKIPGFSHAEEEAADVVIRMMDLAAARKWRLGLAIVAKHEYNRTRPHMHGRKL